MKGLPKRPITRLAAGLISFGHRGRGLISSPARSITGSAGSSRVLGERPWSLLVLLGARLRGSLLVRRALSRARDGRSERAGSTCRRSGPTVKAGLHFLLPVVVLVWCLMVERLSPGLSAFWATVLMILILLTQRPLMAVFRGHGAASAPPSTGG